MQIELLKDLIKDDRGNYYTAIHQDGSQLSLVNAVVERSYRVLLKFTEAFRQKYAEYEQQYIGKMIMDDVRHDVVFALKEDGHGRIWNLEAVEAEHDVVVFIDAIEFYRHPREARG